MKELIEIWKIFIAFRIYGPYQGGLSSAAYSDSLLCPSIPKHHLVNSARVRLRRLS
jgi:hypothetical protein